MPVSTPTRQAIAQPQTVKAPPRRSKLAAMMPFIIWQLVALLFVEGVLYWCGLGEEEIFKLDREIGFTHMPSKRVTWRSEGYSQSYFDADGMREPGLTIAKPAGTYRVALLGDSMVESLQVPLDQTFGRLLEKQVTNQTGRDVQVINFGNSGYSTVQDYLQLKRKVFKYSPDLVIYCYSNRDMFENWSPPDQTITNVRPFALHLPGGKLVIDNYPVLKWMKSPRAKFLKQVEWLRQNSRIYGMISATETQLSFHDPFYRAICAFFTNPKAAVANFGSTFAAAMAAKRAASPSFRIKFFEDNNGNQNAALVNSTITSAPKQIPHHNIEAALVNSAITSAPQEIPHNSGTVELQEVTSIKKAEAVVEIPKTNDQANPISAALAKVDPAKKNYVDLMSRTMGSLLLEMKHACQQHGTKFALATLPCRAGLCPTKDLETAFFNITYDDEITILKCLSAQEMIPYIDVESAAKNLNEQKKLSLFYAVHLKQPGHEFMANELAPYVASQVGKSER